MLHPCKTIVLLLALTLPLAIPPTPARAELPPTAYRAMQRKAPEVVTIRVLAVHQNTTKESWGDRIHVTLTARVLKVTRTKSGLKPRQTITIRYTNDHYTLPMAGPSQTPILKARQTCPAYLSQIKRTTYAPVAGGYSFEKV